MNKVILMGRLAKDVEMKYTSTNNTAICNFPLAVNRKFKQENQPEVDFINIVAWSKTAEFCGKYFTKGQQVAVVGRIQVRTWDDAEGKKRYVTEVVAEDVYFADSKKDNSTTNNSNNAESFYPTIDDSDDSLPF
jgi:single-strand DNA-binding protein